MSAMGVFTDGIVRRRATSDLRGAGEVPPFHSGAALIRIVTRERGKDNGAMRRTVVPFALTVVGLAVAGVSLALGAAHPLWSFSGQIPGGPAALLVPGLGAVLCGAVGLWRQPAARFPFLLWLAGIAWLLVEWNNPETGSAFAFTVGLAFSAAYPAVVAHCAFAWPDGAVADRVGRAVVAAAYVGAVGLLGIVPALVFDPATAGCVSCPRNLLGLGTSVPASDRLLDVGLRVAPVWSVAVVLVVGWRLVRASSAARRLVGPVAVPAAALVLLFGFQAVRSLERGALGADPADRKLWVAQSIALSLTTCGVLLSWVRTRRARAALAQIVLDLSAGPAGAGLAGGLAISLGDPSLTLSYPLPDGRLVDRNGGEIEEKIEALTPIVRGGETVALVGHRAGLLDDPALVTELGSAARLVLDNERLQAELQAGLAELRRARVRIVEAGDAERRRIERNLHDGAQQQLVGLAIRLRLERASAPPELEEPLKAAEDDVRAALAELREVAHGLFPVSLAEEGLAVALAELADGGPAPLRIAHAPDERFDQAVESAAYFLVAHVAGRAGSLSVDARVIDGSLVIDLRGEGLPDEGLIEIEDRIGAVDGSVVLVPGTIRAVLPAAPGPA
jgi:signal transduction histidine kinase